MVAYLELDLTKWRIKQSIVNKWEVGVSDQNGGVVTEPLWQVKLWLAPIIPDRNVSAIEDMIRDMKDYSPRYPKIDYPKKRDGIMLEFGIPDLHLGQLAWSEETRRPSYDTKIAMSAFDAAIKDILQRVTNSFPVDHILLPIGNDFFNIDSLSNTTTSGTFQDEDTRWKKSFKEGRMLMQRTLEKLAAIAPVTVLVIPGNHDEQRSFYLGDVLEVAFEYHPSIIVDNSPTRRKYFRWGNTLIGFAHGKDETERDLPLIMAQEAKDEWSQTQWAEFHIGHYHHTRTRIYTPVDERNGVKVRLLPSLAAPDAWHISKGYTHATRSAMGICWSKTQGMVGDFPYYIQERVA